MKNILSSLTIILLFFFMNDFTSAQKTLEFNQVKLITTQETVPVGKVWKIENIGSPVYYYVSTGSNSTPSIKINGNHIYLVKIRTTQNQSYFGTQSYFFPIWLPANTSLAAGNNINFISVIEFNEISTP